MHRAWTWAIWHLIFRGRNRTQSAWHLLRIMYKKKKVARCLLGQRTLLAAMCKYKRSFACFWWGRKITLLWYHNRAYLSASTVTYALSSKNRIFSIKSFVDLKLMTAYVRHVILWTSIGRQISFNKNYAVCF